MRKILISVSPQNRNKNHAGSKAVMDMEYFLKQMGFEVIYICDNEDKKIKRLIKIILNLRLFLKLNKDIIVFQYPLTSGNLDNIITSLYVNYLNFKKCKTVIIVHDIEFMRFFSNDLGKKKKEVQILNRFKYVVCHNKIMKKQIEKAGVTSCCKTLELFDYSLGNITIKNTVKKKNKKEIAFPGNLDIKKSGFVYKIKELKLKDIVLNLYGPNYESPESENYKGVISPEKLPLELTEGFGLIWDGEDLDTCSGSTGEYLKINNPHKLSLYMATALPVIVWNQSAIAQFVENNKIGITIDSLYNLENKLNQITASEYNTYLKNVKLIQQKVLKGKYIKNVINEILREDNYEK